ncbi:hypothetical protein PIROE2DRAFT_6643 [Piromyces sp. E2]|nr:hypothetical protein PIROE2DRAFT_6643 [Piromyces sp. E2]|eukprot:OUM66207.1 hypothetical protein PIROE2DRAFT_6643 [Piromyces sp. E2]
MNQNYYSYYYYDFDFDNDLELCQKCKVNSEVYYLPCFHPICINCFIKLAEQNFFDMKCNTCQKEINDEIKKQLLGEQKVSKLEKNALMKIIGGDLIKCPNCKEQNTFEPGEVDYNNYIVMDEQNQWISPEAIIDYAKHRCRCCFCKKDFCANKECMVTPYHLGKTCTEFKQHYQKIKKCRFCEQDIKNDNQGPDIDVCQDKECIEKFHVACKKILPCGHKCPGVHGETHCPPCIDNKCSEFGGQFNQNKNDYCTICFTEGLGASPIVVLNCGHYMHYFCVKKRLEIGYTGPDITFNHCLCSSCNKWMNCSSIPELQNQLDQNKNLYQKIKDMALKRLEYENMDKDPRLSDINSPWYGKKEEFAMKHLSYYQCYVCKEPYFGGRRECGNGFNMDDDDNPNNKKFDPKDYVCEKDSNLSGVGGVANCPKHGKDFIEYKCKFCCKIAKWFCWGTTHFCENCHNIANDINKYPKDRLPKCNKETCQVGGNHPPNGEEYALGCSICRSIQENAKDF